MTALNESETMCTSGCVVKVSSCEKRKKKKKKWNAERKQKKISSRLMMPLPWHNGAQLINGAFVTQDGNYAVIVTMGKREQLSRTFRYILP